MRCPVVLQASSGVCPSISTATKWDWPAGLTGQPARARIRRNGWDSFQIHTFQDVPSKPGESRMGWLSRRGASTSTEWRGLDHGLRARVSKADVFHNFLRFVVGCLHLIVVWRSPKSTTRLKNLRRLAQSGSLAG